MTSTESAMAAVLPAVLFDRVRLENALPADWFRLTRLQNGVCPGKRFAAEESPVGRQWRRVGGFNRGMPRMDQRFLAASRFAPQDEHQLIGMFIETFNNTVGKVLPALLLVGTCHPVANGQDGVQQEHALFGPTCQVSARTVLLREVQIR